MLCLLRVLMRHVKIDMRDAVLLHLAVDGAGYDVAGRKRQPAVILFHKRVAVGQFQHCTVATHGLCDEVGRMGLTGVIERRGMELHELHILHCSLGAVDHCFTVACSNDGVGGRLVDSSTATCTHDGNLAQIGVHLVFRVKHIGSVTIDVRSAPCDPGTEMMLRDDFHGKVILLDFNVGIGPDGGHERALYLGAGVVGMMEDAELGVAALTMEVVLSVGLLIEVRPPLHKLFNLTGRFRHHLSHGIRVVDVVTGNNGVVDVLLEVVFHEVGDRRYAALGKLGIGLVERSLADDTYLSFLRPCNLQGVAHSGNTCADDEEIVFVYHNYKVTFAAKVIKRNHVSLFFAPFL